MRYLILILALTACSAANYQPTLAEPKKGFDQSLADCKAVAAQPNRGRDVAIGGFGLLGLAAAAAVDPDAAKSESTLVDECLTKRGYKLAHNS